MSAAALLGVLGVVYGDIGTSPLYAFKASIEHFGAAHIREGDLFGILSLIFWSLVLIVTIKYVSLVMRADNRGEGGILALMVLAQRGCTGARMRRILALIGVSGCCLFFGDGVITPAISVLSAVEGLEVVAPKLQEVVLPISAVVIVILFVVQSRGTGSVGRMFGPVMTLWFLVIGLMGVIQIAEHPQVLMALSPTYGVALCMKHGALAFVALGSVVLAVTGAEALYADMGHFGAPAIRAAWTFFVLPCLALNYFGQGALVMSHPAAAENPFYLMAPGWALIPLVVLATLATVIASQALISGAFSVTRQCMQLGFLPRMRVSHTSAAEEGQIYVPQVNTALMVGVLVLVFAFRSSDALASAYGIAVTATFACTCVLAMVAFMTSWKRGRELLLERWKNDSLPLATFLARLPHSRTIRVPGMAIFMTGNPDHVPAALLHNLKHNKVLHEKVLFVTVTNLDVPEVGPEERALVKELAPGIHRVLLRYGYMESPNLPRDLSQLADQGVTVEPMQASYFLGRETLVAAMAPRMPIWRMWLFLLMARNATPATEFFRIPSDRVVELGVRVAI